jgi:hypothetical protein
VNFEIVGADNMLDTNAWLYNAWLLEINTGPVVKEGDFEMIRGIVEFFPVAAVTSLPKRRAEVKSSCTCNRASGCKRFKLLGPTKS